MPLRRFNGVFFCYGHEKLTKAKDTYMLLASPPKRCIYCFTHLNAARWSSRPAFGVVAFPVSLVPDKKPSELNCCHGLAKLRVCRSFTPYSVIHRHINDVVVALIEKSSRIIQRRLIANEIASTVNPYQDWR